MLPRTRPSPGKCLAVVATPAWPMPRRNATPCAAAVPGSWPNSRCSAPIGAFCWSVPGGTTSITGARSRLTPASPELPPPGRGLRLQGSGRDQPLIQRGGDDRETGALQLLNLPALLVRGDEEPDPGRRLRGRQRLHGVGDGAGTGHPGVAGRPEQHRPEVIGPDGGGRGRVELVGGQSDEEQLADALGLGHPAVDRGRAGRSRGSRGSRGVAGRTGEAGPATAGLLAGRDGDVVPRSWPAGAAPHPAAARATANAAPAAARSPVRRRRSTHRPCPRAGVAIRIVFPFQGLELVATGWYRYLAKEPAAPG